MNADPGLRQSSIEVQGPRVISFNHNKLVALGASFLVLAACSGAKVDSGEGTPTPSPSGGSKIIEKIDNTCGDIDTGKNFADTHFGAATGITTNLYTEKGGNKIPFSSDKVSSNLKNLVAHDLRALAYVKAFMFDTRTAVTPTDLSANNIVNDAQTLIGTYETEKDSNKLKTDLALVCDGLAPSLVSFDPNFNVARNLTSEVVFKRSSGKLVETGVSPAAAPGVLQVFHINANQDSGDEASRVASLKELSNSMGITLDGKLVIKLVTGPLSFDIKKQNKSKTVSLKVGADEQIIVKPKTDSNKLPVGTKQTNSSTGQSSPNSQEAKGTSNTSSRTGSSSTGSSTGTAKSTANTGGGVKATSNTSTGPGTVGINPGPGGSTGGGTTESSTQTTPGSSTTSAETTTATHTTETTTTPPTETTPPPTTPNSPTPTSPTNTTTTTGNTITITPTLTPTPTTTTKGPEPTCVPNPPYVIC